MGTISELFNFDNIGRKIKNFAKWSCWISILILWISSAFSIFIIAISDITLIWIPVISAVCGPFAIWISGWMTYAFGELVENSCNNNVKNTTQNTIPSTNSQNNQPDYSKTRFHIKNAQRTGSYDKEGKPIHKWRCDNCGNTMRTQTPCEHCGKE